MADQVPLREAERQNWDFFLEIPEADRRTLSLGQVKDVQLLQPLFEFSGACAGCGETPYIKLMTQLFGDRALIGNATGCSSIYGGNLPTTPYAVNHEGRGPTWSNSLFEDNAEFALGMRLAVDQQTQYARELVKRLAASLGDELVQALLNADQSTEAGIREQRERVKALKAKLAGISTLEARDLTNVADTLVKKSVWAFGGDGWAYDIGYGGLDHVLASGRNVNVLVLDTEVYSNTGGQMSKATPRGAVAKFAAGGKPRPKKDLGMMAVSLRQRLRGAGGHGFKRHANAQGVPGSRRLRRAVHHHRLQPLHRPRLRPGARHGSAEGRGAVRLLAAVPLQSRPGEAGQESHAVGFAGAFVAARESTSTTKPVTPCSPTAIRKPPSVC